jgi:hypothetical protein
MYLQEEAEARRAGEDWVQNNHLPRASLTCLKEGEELISPVAFVSILKGGHNHRIPKTYRDAMRNADIWMPPMRDEIQQLQERGVYKLIPLSEVSKDSVIIQNMWVYDVKLDGNGEVIKHKARLVARGDKMVEGQDFDVKWAMVARMESVCMILAIAAMLGLSVKQWDFSGAYLNGVLDRAIYMKQPKGFVKLGEENLVCMLLRLLYRLIHAGHIWYNLLAEGYKDLGFRVSRADPCIRTRKDKNGYTLTTTHTDNVLGASSTASESQRVVQEFKSKWELKEVDVNLLVGLTVHTGTNRLISIDQTQYFEKALIHFRLYDLDPISTPLLFDCQISVHVGLLTPLDAEFMRDKPFCSLLGVLIWGACGTQPDISFACGALGRVQNNPTPYHWDLLIGVCRYIRSTMDYGIRYKLKPKNGSLKMVSYVDSDWAGCIDSRRSTSGYVFFMGNSPVSWSSKRQAFVALSSTAAEYVALAHGAQQAMWMRSWLDEVYLPQDGPMNIYGDNLGSLSLTETMKHHCLSKHLDIRCHFIRDLVSEKTVEVHKVKGKENVADIFAKPLPRHLHETFIRELGLDWKRRCVVL